MRTKRPLLCELHAHTTWSDGVLSVRELVDLYGRSGFDVLAVTDHVLCNPLPGHPSIHAGNYDVYLGEIEDEAERARTKYGLRLLPGVELTYEDPNPVLAAHVLAIGLREFIGLEHGLDPALDRARAAGALLIGAHPYLPEAARLAPRGTARLAAEPDWAAEAVHRLELVNRHDFFHWVARRLLPSVATGDFHQHQHLWSWKTVVNSRHEELALVDRLRSPTPVDLTWIDAAIGRRKAA